MVKKNYDQIIESQLISSDFFFSHVIESRTLLKILKNTSMHQAQGLNALVSFNIPNSPLFLRFTGKKTEAEKFSSFLKVKQS